MKKIISRLVLCTMLALMATGCSLTANQKKVLAVVGVVAAVVVVVLACKDGGCGGSGESSYSSYDGNCQYAWQTASDGSRCGDRSAASRPGGWPW